MTRVPLKDKDNSCSNASVPCARNSRADPDKENLIDVCNHSTLNRSDPSYANTTNLLSAKLFLASIATFFKNYSC